MKSLLDLLPVMIRLSGEQEDVCEQASFAAWKATTGSQLANTCQPFRLYNGTLVVSVIDATWKRQMELISRELIFKINAMLGHSLVKFIEFRVDHAHVAASRPPEREPKPATKLTSETDLLAAGAEIKDVELRDLFLRAAGSALRQNGD